MISEIFEKLLDVDIESILKYSKLMTMYKNICLLMTEYDSDTRLDWPLIEGIHEKQIYE